MLSISHHRVAKLETDNTRLSANQVALTESVQHYITESQRHAASVQQLQLTRSELEHQHAEMADVIKDLKIKLKRVASATTTATSTEVSIQTEVRDSIAQSPIDSMLHHLQIIRWSDPWVSLSATIHPNRQVDADIVSRDTLHQVIHRVPKKFLFFRFGCKAIRQEIVSRNPHTKIVYSRYIELKK